MSQTIGETDYRVTRVVRRHSDWTLKEHEVAVSYWPDIAQITKRIPHRTPIAIKAFASKCNLRKPLHSWTEEQHSLLRKSVREGLPCKEIAHELRLSTQQVASRMYHSGLKYARKPPKPSGNVLVDSIKKRAFDLNFSMKELDEACGSGKRFTHFQPTSGVHIKHVVKAAKVLEGEICIRWSEL